MKTFAYKHRVSLLASISFIYLLSVVIAVTVKNHSTMIALLVITPIYVCMKISILNLCTNTYCSMVENYSKIKSFKRRRL